MAPVSELEQRDGFICAVVAQVNSADFAHDTSAVVDPRKANALLVPDRLKFARGETLQVVSMDGCPQGHWRCRNGRDEVGYVPSCDVAIDATIVATRMNDIVHARAMPSPRVGGSRIDTVLASASPHAKSHTKPPPPKPKPTLANDAMVDLLAPTHVPAPMSAGVPPTANAAGPATVVYHERSSQHSESYPQSHSAVLPKSDAATAAAPATTSSGSGRMDTYAVAVPASRRASSEPVPLTTAVATANDEPAYENIEGSPEVATNIAPALVPQSAASDRHKSAPNPPPPQQHQQQAQAQQHQQYPESTQHPGAPQQAITPAMLYGQEEEADLYSEDDGVKTLEPSLPDEVDVGTMYGNPLHTVTETPAIKEDAITVAKMELEPVTAPVLGVEHDTQPAAAEQAEPAEPATPISSSESPATTAAQHVVARAADTQLSSTPRPAPRHPRKEKQAPSVVFVKALYDYQPEGDGLSFAEVCACGVPACWSVCLCGHMLLTYCMRACVFVLYCSYVYHAPSCGLCVGGLFYISLRMRSC